MNGEINIIALEIYYKWRMARRFKKWMKLRNTHFYINEDKVESINTSKQQEKTKWHVIGQTTNRQSKQELQNLFFETDDCVGIEKSLKKERSDGINS